MSVNSEHYDVLVENGWILTPEGLIKGCMAIEDGIIANLGKKVSTDRVIDARNGIVMPGLINAHTHLGMTLLRGYADDFSLVQWLNEYIWPVEARLDERGVYVGSLLGCVEMIKSGTTTCADMYIHMDGTARAVEEAGIRGVLSYGMIELGDKTRAEKELKIGKEFVKKWNNAANGRITTMYGPHAPNTCSPEFLSQVKELSDKDGVKIHTHLAETETEINEIQKKHDMSPVRLLDKIGFLGPDILAAHCVWLSDEDIQILKRNDVKVAHNPTSNMKLGSGIAPIPELLKCGVIVALGTDGCASNNDLDMFREMKMAALLHKVSKLDPTIISAREALNMATINGARSLGIDAGAISIGRKADIIIVDTNKPHLTPKHDMVSHLVYCAKGSDVSTCIVDGKILMENYELTTLNESKIMADAERVASDLIDKVK